MNDSEFEKTLEQIEGCVSSIEIDLAYIKASLEKLWKHYEEMKKEKVEK